MGCKLNNLKRFSLQLFIFRIKFKKARFAAKIYPPLEFLLAAGHSSFRALVKLVRVADSHAHSAKPFPLFLPSLSNCQARRTSGSLYPSCTAQNQSFLVYLKWANNSLFQVPVLYIFQIRFSSHSQLLVFVSTIRDVLRYPFDASARCHAHPPT